MAKNFQQIMEKFTKLAGARLYKIDVKVEFCYYMADGFKVWAGECDKKNKTIIFNSCIFKEDELDDRAWYYILHELSHLKTVRHNKTYWKELENNFEKTMDLRKQFCDEAGLDEDYYIDLEYTPYDYPKRPNPTEVDAEIDYENLEDEDTFFEVYNIFKLD